MVLTQALPFVAGTSVGVLTIFTGVSAGLFGVLTTYPTLYSALKFLGAGYLLYVAWGIANFQFDNDPSNKHSAGFIAGLGIQVLNPKAWIAAYDGIFSIYRYLWRL
ncbi:LysE family translocator [Psychromonas sp. KJ10-10]|uniref:LysE family translocator n=1 Tax=Psychromonas sp. KJ10-10 TaxID=3391823 RepID=UPI0039B6CCB5